MLNMLQFCVRVFMSARYSFELTDLCNTQLTTTTTISIRRAVGEAKQERSYHVSMAAAVMHGAGGRAAGGGVATSASLLP